MSSIHFSCTPSMAAYSSDSAHCLRHTAEHAGLCKEWFLRFFGFLFFFYSLNLKTVSLYFLWKRYRDIISLYYNDKDSSGNSIFEKKKTFSHLWLVLSVVRLSRAGQGSNNWKAFCWSCTGEKITLVFFLHRTSSSWKQMWTLPNRRNKKPSPFLSLAQTRTWWPVLQGRAQSTWLRVTQSFGL